MINLIAAAAKNGVIGSAGKIPWDIPEDKAYFRKITSGNIVIMGRRTFEEIGFPLPDRYNIILSRKKNFSGKALCTAASLAHALEIAHLYAKEQHIPEIFLCGGEQVYIQGLKFARRIYLTRLYEAYAGDTFFPKFSTDQFRLSSCTHQENLCFCIYDRNQKKNAL